jgi:hypothetical protein
MGLAIIAPALFLVSVVLFVLHEGLVLSRKNGSEVVPVV